MAFCEMDEDVLGNEETIASILGVFSFQILLDISLSGSDIDGVLCLEVSEWVWGLLKSTMMNL